MIRAMGQSFPFVHPALAWAALAAGLIPIIIHLINRRRFVRMPWAAMMFLLAANRRSARRVRLEQWLLLATRVLLIVLFGLAVARPYLPATQWIPLRESRVHRVLLLDNSLSMNMTTPAGQTRFSLAKRNAEALLSSFPASDAVSIVTLASPAQAVIAQAALDRRFIREQLHRVTPTQRSTDTVGALTTTLDILQRAEFAPGNRAVYLISDLPRAVWRNDDHQTDTPAVEAVRRLTAALGEQGVALTVVRIAQEPLQNAAITELTAEAPLIGVSLPVLVSTRITNFGSSTLRNLVLQLRRDGQTVRRHSLPPLPPGESSAVTMTTEFVTPGTHLVEARLSEREADALKEDNTRYLSVEVRPTTPVLLVDGRPGVDRLAGQTGLLATALSPRVSGTEQTLITSHVITEPELAAEALDEYDVVALCNVRRLAREQWRRLETFVARGGGLFVFGGDLIDADNYNRFGYARGEGLLGATIKYAPESKSENAEPAGIDVNKLIHPMVAEFGDQPESGLFAARFDRYLPVEVDVERGEEVLSYTNGKPMLIASSLGRGRVLLCTTTANMDWNNLPAKGDYVALMLNAMAYLSPRHGSARNIMVGDSIRERLTPVEQAMSLRVITGEGAMDEPSLTPDGDALALTYGPIERARPVTVSIGNEQRVFAANVDPDESDPATVTEKELRQVLGERVRIVNGSWNAEDAPVTAQTTELGPAALYAVAVLLLIEMALAMWFSSQRVRGTRPRRKGTGLRGLVAGLISKQTE